MSTLVLGILWHVPSKPVQAQLSEEYSRLGFIYFKIILELQPGLAQDGTEGGVYMSQHHAVARERLNLRNSSPSSFDDSWSSRSPAALATALSEGFSLHLPPPHCAQFLL